MIWFEEILQGIYTIQYDALLVTLYTFYQNIHSVYN